MKTIGTIAAILLAAATLTSCSEIAAGSTEPVPGGEISREWLLVVVAYDQNELLPSVEEDIHELASCQDPGHRIHRVVLRDSQRSESRAILIDEAGRHPLENLLAAEASLFRGDHLAAAYAALSDRFPHRGAILVFSGHGRGRHGFGMTDEDPSMVFDDREIERFYRAIDTEDHPLFAVFDGSYATHLEFLYPFRTTRTTVIGHTGNLRAGGLDYAGLTAAIADGDSDDPAVGETLTALVDEAEVMPDEGGSGAIRLTPTSIAAAADSIGHLAEAIRLVSDDPDSQEALQATLLSDCVAPTLPGDASVSLDRVISVAPLASELAGTAPWIVTDAPWHRLYLHLVLLDELGTPRGHDSDYRPDLRTPTAPSFCLETPWAPDITHGLGFLWDLWYRRY